MLAHQPWASDVFLQGTAWALCKVLLSLTGEPPPSWAWGLESPFVAEEPMVLMVGFGWLPEPAERGERKSQQKGELRPRTGGAHHVLAQVPVPGTVQTSP